VALGDGHALDPALAGRLRARPWRAGDRIDGRGRPCAELLGRAGVPRTERAVRPVVELDGRIVCLPGVAVAPAHARTHGLLLDYAVGPAARA
jgi:hypothetical protein